MPATASSDPIPAIVESEASGETARIFADIRATLGLPVVNLIWRHLATVEGGLDWAWNSARPIYAGGHAAAVAGRLFDRLDPPLPLPLPPGALACVGLGAADLAAARAVAAAYNRGNGLNLLTLTALLVEPGSPQPGSPQPGSPGPGLPDAGPAAAGSSAPSVPAGPVPALLSEAEVAPATWALVRALNTLGARPDEPILASMYRHLAHWPGLLALMHAGFAPLAADGRLAAAIERTGTLARAEARGLARLRVDAGPPPPAARAALVEFTDHVIGRMVPICLAFSRWV